MTINSGRSIVPSPLRVYKLVAWPSRPFWHTAGESQHTLNETQGQHANIESTSFLIGMLMVPAAR